MVGAAHLCSVAAGEAAVGGLVLVVPSWVGFSPGWLGLLRILAAQF